MLEKDVLIKSLKKLGFVPEKSKTTNGSHFNFTHVNYPLIKVCVVDHKDRTSMSRNVEQDIISGIAFACVLDCLNQNQAIDDKFVSKYLAVADSSIATQVRRKINNLKLADNHSLISLMPTKLQREIYKFIKNPTNDNIITYFKERKIVSI